MILQARILEWISMPTPRGSSQPRNQTHISYVSCIDRQVLYHLLLFSCSIVSDCLRPHGLQHARLLCPLPTLRACSNSYPSSQWCHRIMSVSVVLLSSCLQSFPTSGSFQMNQMAKVWSFSFSISPLGLTGLILLQSRVLSRVFNTRVQKHQFISSQPSLWSNSPYMSWKNH